MMHLLLRRDDNKSRRPVITRLYIKIVYKAKGAKKPIPLVFYAMRNDDISQDMANLKLSSEAQYELQGQNSVVFNCARYLPR